MRSKENTLFFLCFLSTVHEYLSQALPLTHQQVDPSFLFVKVLQILLSSVDDRCISSHQNFFGSTFFFFPICAVLPMPVFIFSCSSWDVETEKNMLLRTAAQRQQYIYLYFLTFFPSTLSVRANDYRFNFFGRSPFLHQKVYHALGFD